MNFSGLVLGFCCNRIRMEDKYLLSYITVSTSQLLMAAAIYLSLSQLSLDVMWTLPLATKWCMNAAWIHLDMTPFFCFIRDASALLGKYWHE